MDPNENDRPDPINDGPDKRACSDPRDPAFAVVCVAHNLNTVHRVGVHEVRDITGDGFPIDLLKNACAKYGYVFRDHQLDVGDLEDGMQVYAMIVGAPDAIEMAYARIASENNNA